MRRLIFIMCVVASAVALLGSYLLAPSAALAAPASHPQAAAASDASASADATATDPATNCEEHWHTVITHHFPIIGTPYWTVDTNYTSNPCHNNNGLEAAIQYTVVRNGDKVTIYGNDIHKLGATSDLGIVDAARNNCDKWGVRWWDGSNWQYHWATSACP